MYAPAATIMASAALILAQGAAAQGSVAQIEQAVINVEASHGGAGSGLTNTTITVDIGTVFTGDPALQAVSTLYLVGGVNVDFEDVTCTPYKATNGTGSGGLPFNSTTPSYLSTNTVVVGSIVCEVDA